MIPTRSALYSKVGRRFNLFRSYSKGKWIPVVGLEVHAQIQSYSKLFSGAGTQFRTSANNAVALFDAAFPGTLPVLNSRCVEAGVLTALALSCKLNPVSSFDRKHYFYADLPAGYQITQQRNPLARHGHINFIVQGKDSKLYKKTSKIHQIQLEQDSGRSLHDDTRSLVDLNRAGVPLMELVFEPDLSDGEEAAALVKELCLILTRLQTCSCKMEEGALRVDANISVHKKGTPLGTRTEVKNISSPRAIANAVQYEINRQISLLEKGDSIVNETRSWDAIGGCTVPMRDKEEKQDYRYMPEPNLPPLHLRMDNSQPANSNTVDVQHLHKLLPELPEQTRNRMQGDFGVSLKHALIIVNDDFLWVLFFDVMKSDPKRNATILCNFLINDVLTYYNKDPANFNLSSEVIGEVVDLLQSGSINKSMARQVLDIHFEDRSRSPLQIIKEEKMEITTDINEVESICKSTLEQYPEIVKVHLSGKKDKSKDLAKKVWEKAEGRIDMNSVKSWIATNLPYSGKKSK